MLAEECIGLPSMICQNDFLAKQSPGPHTGNGRKEASMRTRMDVDDIISAYLEQKPGVSPQTSEHTTAKRKDVRLYALLLQMLMDKLNLAGNASDPFRVIGNQQDPFFTNQFFHTSISDLKPCHHRRTSVWLPL